MELEPIELGLEEVHLWPIFLDPEISVVHELEQLLTADELARADRFVTAELRRRFVVCRGRLRQLIGRATSQPAAKVRFRYEMWGKPQLAPESTKALKPVQFNVSHSASRALIALAATPVGVDIEVPREPFHYRAIASQVLSETEQENWAALPPKSRDAAIIQLWVCKEAILKALGLGIAEGLRKISFPLPIPERGAFAPVSLDSSLQMHLDEDGTCRMNSWLDPVSWRVAMIPELLPSYAAVTRLRQVHRVVLHDEM